MTEDNVAKLVEGERDAWVLVFAGTEEADLPSPGLSGLAEATYGQIKVGKVAPALASKFGITIGKKPQLVSYPYRTPGVKRKASKPAEGSEEGVALVKKTALESIPDSGVEKLTAMNIDKFMQEGMMTTELKTFALVRGRSEPRTTSATACDGLR